MLIRLSNNESNKPRFDSLTQKFVELWSLKVEKWKNAKLRKMHSKLKKFSIFCDLRVSGNYYGLISC